jgi:catechol-2,3-dioxygenase
MAAHPPLAGVDHVHVFVADRRAAEAWYASVLGMNALPEFRHWAADGGPLTVADAGGTVHIALFERPTRPHRSTVALRTSAAGLAAWQRHLSETLPQPPSLEDHEQSLSLYFADPDGNPYEITSYEAAAARALLAS